MPKFLIVFLLLVFSVQVAAQCDKPLRVGVGAHWPPYFVVDEQQLSGVDLEIIAITLNSIGHCAEFIRLPSPNRMRAEFVADRVDVLMALSYTDERAAFGVYSNPYRQERLRLMVNSKRVSDPDVPLKALLKQRKTLVLTENSYFGEEVAEFMHDPVYKRQIVYVSKVPLRFAMVASGHVDMTVIDEQVASYLTQQIHADDVRFGNEVVTQENVHFLINKRIATPAFMAQFNQALSEHQSAFDNRLNALLQLQ